MFDVALSANPVVSRRCSEVKADLAFAWPFGWLKQLMLGRHATAHREIRIEYDSLAATQKYPAFDLVDLVIGSHGWIELTQRDHRQLVLNSSSALFSCVSSP
jgi:hypothetical protein